MPLRRLLALPLAALMLAGGQPAAAQSSGIIDCAGGTPQQRQAQLTAAIAAGGSWRFNAGCGITLPSNYTARTVGSGEVLTLDADGHNVSIYAASTTRFLTVAGTVTMNGVTLSGFGVRAANGTNGTTAGYAPDGTRGANSPDVGGSGGVGTDGGDGEDGTPGSAGDHASGGTFLVEASGRLTLDDAAIDGSLAEAGDGGYGGSGGTGGNGGGGGTGGPGNAVSASGAGGTGGSGGDGGQGASGGRGGDARGGAILNRGTVVLVNAAFTRNRALGGSGGDGGGGGFAGDAGSGGSAGSGGTGSAGGAAGAAGAGGTGASSGPSGDALGGAIYNDGGTLTATGTTFSDNEARGGGSSTGSGGEGGEGADGGAGAGYPTSGPAGASSGGGDGGDAGQHVPPLGAARGGAVYSTVPWTGGELTQTDNAIFATWTGSGIGGRGGRGAYMTVDGAHGQPLDFEESLEGPSGDPDYRPQPDDGGRIAGTVFRVNSASGDILDEGEEAELRLRVENRSTGTLSEVRVVGAQAVPTDEPDGLGRASVAGPTDDGLAETLPTSGTDFADFDFVAQKAGAVRVEITVEAIDAEGEPVRGTFTWDATIDPKPLAVELTASVPGQDPPAQPGDPLRFQLNENDHENRFTVKLTLRNRGDEDITALRFSDPDEPLDFDSERTDESGSPVPGVALEYLGDRAPDLPQTTLAPGESTSVTFQLEAFDDVDAVLSSIAYGLYDGDEISGRGAVDVEVPTDVLVEFGMRGRSDSPMRGGTAIRLEGRLKNVSEDATIGVVAYPTTGGNAGNGIVFPAASAGRTPDTPYGFVLTPDQEVDVAALLPTAELAVASDAEVSWSLHVWRHEVDEDTGEITKIRAPANQVRILDTDGYGDELSFRLPPGELLPDAPGTCAFAYFGCGIVNGLANLGRSNLDLIRLAGSTFLDFGNQQLQLIAWAGQMLGETSLALQGDPAARARLHQELELDARSLVDAGALTAEQFTALVAALPSVSNAFFDTWVGIMNHGDLETMKTELGRMVGENPDAVASVFVAARLGRKLLTGAASTDNAVRQALVRHADERAGTLAERIASAEGSGSAVRTADVFDAGDPLSKRMQSDYWGADTRDVDAIGEIADAERAAITYGALTPEANDLLRTGAAWPAPRELGLKPVTELDELYLGYRPQTKGVVELVEPPRDLQLAYLNGADEPLFRPRLRGASDPLTPQQLQDLTDGWVARNHPDLDADLAARVSEQLQTRIEEFYSGYRRFRSEAFDYTTDGVARIELGVGKARGEGGTVVRRVWDERTVRTTALPPDTCPVPAFCRTQATPAEIETAKQVYGENNLPAYFRDGRLYLKLELDGTGSGAFRPVTGGVKLLAITGEDGKLIRDVAKRERLYDHLQKSVGMANGELDNFVATGKVEGLGAYRRGEQAAVTLSPGRRANASYVIDRSAVTADSVNAGKRLANEVGDFLIVAGHTAPWRARLGGFRNAVLDSLLDTLDEFYNLPLYFIPSSLHRFVDGLSDEQVPDAFDRDGATARPDGDGGLEEHAGGPSGRSRGARSGTSGWTSVGVSDALAAGDPNVLELAPQTALSEPASAGATRIEVSSAADLGMAADSPWFRAGDRVIVDPGGPNEETAQVTGLGSLVMAAPLTKDHEAGEMVILRAADPPAPVTPTEPQPPAPAPVPAPVGGSATPSAPGPSAPPATRRVGRFASKLQVERATVRRKERRLDVLAPITARASGKVGVKLQADGRTVDLGGVAIDSRRGRVRFAKKLDAGQARQGSGILQLTYGGDEDSQGQEVRLRAAPRKASLDADRPKLQNGKVTAAGTISKQARGVVRVQLVYENAAGETETIELKAKIGKGRFSLAQPLTAAQRSGIADRLGVVHSYVLFTGYAPRDMRGEMQAFEVLPAP